MILYQNIYEKRNFQFWKKEVILILKSACCFFMVASVPSVHLAGAHPFTKIGMHPFTLPELIRSVEHSIRHLSLR